MVSSLVKGLNDHLMSIFHSCLLSIDCIDFHFDNYMRSFLKVIISSTLPIF